MRSQLWRRVLKKIFKTSHTNPTVFCSELSDVNNALFNDNPAQIKFFVEPHKLCMHGAFRYHKGWHPFIAALESGRNVLTQFYGCFQPKDLAEMYFLNKVGWRGEDVPPWTLPWMSPDEEYAPTSEHGLPVTHGVSYYGPASPEKISLELSRLTTTLESIKSHGYNSEVEGGISGWFLEFEGDFVFFVRGGKHRAAILSHLDPKQPIPVRVRDPYLPVVRYKDSHTWPMVANGILSEKIAVAVFKRYFEFRGEQAMVML